MESPRYNNLIGIYKLKVSGWLNKLPRPKVRGVKIGFSSYFDVSVGELNPFGYRPAINLYSQNALVDFYYYANFYLLLHTILKIFFYQKTFLNLFLIRYQLVLMPNLYAQ